MRVVLIGILNGLEWFRKVRAVLRYLFAVFYWERELF